MTPLILTVLPIENNYYDLLPSSFANFFQTVASMHSYNTRLASKSTLYINTIKTNYGKFNIRFATVKVWKQGFAFTNERMDGDNSWKLFWVKAFLGGTRWLREGNRNLLRLLTILERMTNDNRVGSNVDLFCKLYYNFDQNGPGQGWFDPVLFPLSSYH